MSILDALKVQKANQQSISDLAVLPQNEIIRLAQMGQIPADVVPVVISEKARMAKEAANMRAAAQMQQQGGRMPTVIEQAMQANAQAEAPQMPPQQPGLPGAMPGAQAQAPMQMPPQAPPQAAPQEAGVAGLPTGQMFQGQNFQAGGIVAYSEGGEMPELPSKDLIRAFANAQRDNATGRDIQVLMAGLGMDAGSVGINFAKMSDGERDQLAQNLVAQYGSQFGDLGVQGQMVRPMNAPSGVFGLGASASYPVGQGRLSAGVNAMRTPQDTRVTGYNVGYGGKVGPGFLSAGANFPKGGKPSAEMRYQIPFEEGGVVGYNGEEGSFVETPGGLNVLKEELQPKAPGAMPTSLADYIKQVQEASAPFRTLTQEEKDLEAARAKGMSQGEKDQQKYMRLLEAGLGIMGGESPYALTNIGKGSQAALKGYSEDVREQQKQKMEELKGRAEAAKAKRLEGLEDVKTGSALYKEYMQNEAAAQRAKDSQLGAKFADNYVAMKKAGGDQRPDEVIRDEGYRQFFQEYGFASGRAATQAQIAAGAQGVQAAGITERYANQAQDSVDKTLKSVSSPEAREHRKLLKGDAEKGIPPNPEAAAQYRQRLINQRAQELASAGAAVSGGAPAPAAAPSGSKAPDISKIKGAPSGSTVGAFVAGKGWEIKGKDGTLLGYAKQ